VVSAAFSPDGTRVVTASKDNTARLWDVQPDTGTLDQWSAFSERGLFVLDGGALVRRISAGAQMPPN
jgi:WD40 repeat protein